MSRHRVYVVELDEKAKTVRTFDATHARTTLTVTRRDGSKEVVERSFEVPPQSK